MKQTQVVKLINKFNNNLNKDSLCCKFKIKFENHTPSSNNTHLDNIMFYNDILDYIERENNNEDGVLWKLREILNHSLISGKKGKDDKIEIQLVWEMVATSIECFEALKKNILIDLAIYAKENDLLEIDKWKTLERLVDRSKLTDANF